MRFFFFFFFLSGFCSILYEVIWLRLSMAQFGVTSAVVSIVLSSFMAGLGLGSLLSGYLIREHGAQIKSPILYYAAIEGLIGLSALLVPYQLIGGNNLLNYINPSSSWSYYFFSGTFIALTLIPWCACMGATIPLGMMAIRKSYYNKAQGSFSFLYLANVFGAVAGAFLPLLFIELYGFHQTLFIGAALNGLIALLAVTIKFPNSKQAQVPLAQAKKRGTPSKTIASKKLLILLFASGLTSMGMEIVWVRLYVPYLGNVVYAFASILGVYLFCTFVGSQIYRKFGDTDTAISRLVWFLVGLTSLFPLLATLPALQLPSWSRLFLGIGFFSSMLGYITPLLVDRWSAGAADKAGTAYAVNIAGCILGPLLAGFLLLPLVDERWVLYSFALPWFLLSLMPGRDHVSVKTYRQHNALTAVLVLIVFTLVLRSSGFPGYQGGKSGFHVLRDHTATVIASGKGMYKHLSVNGSGMTILTPITKLMAHLPLAFLDHTPQNALVVCFGMGTTYRSLLSWGVDTTAVELVPSVPKFFGYFHEDAATLVKLPKSHVVIDDGRRYLKRTPTQYDVITIDPPPPVEAAGSSLLYTKEFYAIAKSRLKPNGILQQWLPGRDVKVQVAVTRALVESFKNVRVFHDQFGHHFIASDSPIPVRTAAELAARMPAKAKSDLIEWEGSGSAEDKLASILSQEVSPFEIISNNPQVHALQDDKPLNEYYLLRKRNRKFGDVTL